MHTATKWFTDAGLWRFECKQGDYKQDGSANWRESTRLFREHRRAVGEHPYEPGVNLTTTVTVNRPRRWTRSSPGQGRPGRRFFVTLSGLSSARPASRTWRRCGTP